MLTPSHGFLANIFSLIFRRRWTCKLHLLFFLGAVIPDFPLIFVGALQFLRHLIAESAIPSSTQVLENTRSSLVFYPVALLLRKLLHSAFFWISVLLVGYGCGKKLEGLKILAYGALFFHLLIDWPTHKAWAHSYFWPIWDRPLPGLVSVGNPILLGIEAAIWISWLAILTYRLFKQKPGQRPASYRTLRQHVSGG